MPSTVKLMLLTTMVVYGLTLVTCKTSIEKDILSKASSAVEQSNINNVAIHVIGRDVSLTVDAKDVENTTSLENSVLSLKGVRVVNTISRPIPALQIRAENVLESYPESNWIQISVDGDDDNHLIITGMSYKQVPNDLITQLQSLENLEQFSNQTTNIPAPSLAVFEALLNKDIPWAKITVENNSGMVEISGETTENATKNEIIDIISNIPGVKEVNDNVDILALLDYTSCQSNLDAMLNEETILFAFNKTEIDAQSRVLLEKLAKVTRQCPDAKIEISGHTDDQGETYVNRHFSSQRAEAVKAALIDLGIDAQRLSAKGYGESQPVTSNATLEGRQKNRRIAFTIVENQTADAVIEDILQN